MAHWPQRAPLAAEGMQEPEGSHHGTPEDAPQCTKKEDLTPIGPSVPQPLRVLTLPGRANTAPPMGAWLRPGDQLWRGSGECAHQSADRGPRFPVYQ